MRDDEPYFEDEVDIEPPQSKKTKKGVPTIVWMVVGAGGLVILGSILFLMERSDRRRAQAMWMEVEAQERAMQAKQKATMPMEVQLPREELAQRLIDSRLESIRDDGVWSFTSEHFVLEAGAKPLPKDLLETLLGLQQSASRIEGKWKLDEDGSLRLTDIRGDGNAGLGEVRLWVEPAGRLRMNIGEHQYNFFRNKAEKK